MIKTWDNSCLFKHLRQFTRGHTDYELEILNNDKVREKLNKEQLLALKSLLKKFDSFDKKLTNCIEQNITVKEDIGFDIV